MQRYLSTHKKIPPPPPPPPPPPRPPSSSQKPPAHATKQPEMTPITKRVDGGRESRSTSGKKGPLILLLAIAGGIGIAQANGMIDMNSLFSNNTNTGSSNHFGRRRESTETQQEYTGSSRAYLEELAAKGDSDASVLMKSENTSKDTTFDPETYQANFRLDTGRQGLLATLEMMLDVKRREEREEIQRIRSLPIERRHVYLEEGLKQLKHEKAELKTHIKALKKRQL